MELELEKQSLLLLRICLDATWEPKGNERTKLSSGFDGNAHLKLEKNAQI